MNIFLEELMRIRQFMLFIGIFTMLFCSCETSQEGGGSSSAITSPSNVPPRKFWAMNLVTEKYYQIDAELLAESANCRVWVEKGSGVSAETASSMANAYENDILPKMLSTFARIGPISDGEKIIANNTMQLADWLGDGDGKLCILLLDIVDGYKQGVNDSYCAGYFWAGNLFEKTDTRDPSFKYSNESDMIYIDTYPGRPGSRESNATFAHEMQHMMSYANTRMTKRSPYPLDIWIDEGLSLAAEWVYYGSHSVSRVNWYNQDPSGLIKKGNNFFVWDNRGSENQYAVLDDYATAYLFFQWLRLQAGSSDIYYNLTLSDEYYDYRAVTNAANRAIPGQGYNNWGTLLKTWHAANYINAPSGPYGYKDDATLKNIRAKTAPAGVMTLPLAPGEGVYSITNGSSLPGNTQYINYAGLNRSGAEMSDTKTFSGGALLTFNSNSNTGGSTVSGTTTGVASAVTANMDIASGDGLFEDWFPGPFAIGAGDILRQNGHEVPLTALNTNKGIVNIE